LRIIYLFLLLIATGFSAQLKELQWERGETFLTFLQANNIPQSLYFDLEKLDRELCSEITAGVTYQVLEDEKTNEMLQVLIPISEEMQIHLYKENGKFVFSTTPISFEEVTQTIAIPISFSPYQDILDATSNPSLANEFIRSFNRLADFKRMRKGNHVAIKYTQRIRMGKYYGTPIIHSAVVETYKKKTFIFRNEKDGRYYDETGKNLTSFFMVTPVRYTRISDRFTYKRWHPIKKRYRPHLGIDYAAPSGRPIVAAASGKVIYRGNKGGYGKTVEIRHEGNYKTLYAHMSRFSKVKRGQWVKQGQVIGYIGSTGLSTGPHLHFGLYKNNRAVNPAGVIRVAKTELKGDAKKQFVAYAKKEQNALLQTIENKPMPLNLVQFSNLTALNMNNEV
jgi:murein DD-endopeptidase MepM/ murein hydrolase activator NlpD